MTITFIETVSFMAVRDDYFISDDNFRAFQQTLLDNPRRGDVIPGTGGLRKVRFADPRRGKGKRGGLRVVYVYIENENTIGLLDIYDKDESSNLSVTQQRVLVSLAEAMREEVAQANRPNRKQSDERK